MSGFRENQEISHLLFEMVNRKINEDRLQIIALAMLLDTLPDRTFTLTQTLLDKNSDVFENYHIHFKRRRNADVATFDVVLERDSIHDPNRN